MSIAYRSANGWTYAPLTRRIVAPQERCFGAVVEAIASCSSMLLNAPVWVRQNVDARYARYAKEEEEEKKKAAKCQEF